MKNIFSFMEVLGVESKIFVGSCRYYVLFTYFCRFVKVFNVIVKIIEASMCYVGVIDVYYNENEADKDDDVVISNPEYTSYPSPYNPPQTPINGNSPPNRFPPTITPPRRSCYIVGTRRLGWDQLGGEEGMRQ